MTVKIKTIQNNIPPIVKYDIIWRTTDEEEVETFALHLPKDILMIEEQKAITSYLDRLF